MLSPLTSRARTAARSPLARASIALMAAQGISGLIGLLFWMLVSRPYPAAEVGQATTLIALTTAITLLTTAGMAPALLLAIPRASNPHQASAASWIAAGIAAFTAAGVALLAALTLPALASNLSFLTHDGVLLALVLTAAANAASAVADPTATATKRAWLVTVRAFTFSVAKIVFLYLFLQSGQPPVLAVAYAWALGAITTGLLTIAWAHRWVLPRAWKSALTAARAGVTHHHISAIAAQLPPLLVAVMVTAVVGTAASAQYSIAWAVAAMFFMVSPAIAAVTIAHTAADTSRLRPQIRHAAWFTLAIVTVPILITVVFGGDILSAFGTDYRAAAPLLIVFAISVPPDAVINLAVAAARVQGHLRAATGINLSRGAVTLTSTWLLLPHIGLIAAGISWLLGQIVGTVIVMFYVQRNHPRSG